MKNILSYIAGAMMLLIPALAGAQALPFTVSDADPVVLGKGGAGLVETGSVSHAAFTNSAAVPFSESKLDVSAGYMLWQPSSINSNVISLGAAYNWDNKLGVAAGLYYGMNPEYSVSGASGAHGDLFRPSDIHAALGVSYRFLDFMSVGLNFGYASSCLAEGRSLHAFAGDAFVMAKFAEFKVTAGVSNVLGTVKNANGDEYRLPGSVALGAGYETVFDDRHAVEANLDVDCFFSGWLAASLGAGYTYNDLISVRCGYHYGGESPIPSYFSIGHGVRLMGVSIDFAYMIATSDSPMKDTLALSVGYSF